MTTIAQEEVLRRMRLAQALRDQANTPIQADPRGAVSWTQGLAKILQNVGAARQEQRAVEDAKLLRAQRQQALAAAMQLPPDQQPAALMGVEGFEDTGAKLMIESSRNKQLAEMLAAAARGNPNLDPNQLTVRATVGGPDAALDYVDRMTPTPAQERDYRFKVDERDYTRTRDAAKDARDAARDAYEGIPTTTQTQPAQPKNPEFYAWLTSVSPSLEGKFNLPPGSVEAMSEVESGHNPDAVSPTGVRGPLQVTDAVGDQMNLDRNDPRQNTYAGAQLMGRLWQKYNDPELVGAAYNSGEEAVDRALQLQKETGTPWQKSGLVREEGINHGRKFAAAYQRIQERLSAGAISPKQAQEQTAKLMDKEVEQELKQEMSPLEQERLNIEKERLAMDKQAAEDKKKNPMGLTAQQMGNVRQKQKLITNVLVPQLERLKQTILAKKDDGSLDPAKINPDLTASTGFLQGRIPKQFTELGGTLEADVDNIRSTITSLKRVPGVGAQSNYEAMLDQAPLPTRTDDPNTLLRKIQNLEATIMGYKNLNDELVSDVGSASNQGFTIELAQ